MRPNYNHDEGDDDNDTYNYASRDPITITMIRLSQISAAAPAMPLPSHKTTFLSSKLSHSSTPITLLLATICVFKVVILSLIATATLSGPHKVRGVQLEDT